MILFYDDSDALLRRTSNDVLQLRSKIFLSSRLRLLEGEKILNLNRLHPSRIMMNALVALLFPRGTLLVILLLLLFTLKSTPFSASAVQFTCFEITSTFSSFLWKREPVLTPLPSIFKNTRRPSTVKTSRKLSQTNNDDMGLQTGESGNLVRILHQGHTATIFVRKDEPILHALERQSTSSNISIHPQSLGVGNGESNDILKHQSSLALSHVPHECRRGNCLTCSARLQSTSHERNLLANVDNGLSPTIDNELTQSGYILTCCSFVTGPGVILELGKNDDVWEAIYRRRIRNGDSTQLGMEARARLLRRVDEENVGRWKRQMECIIGEFDSGLDDEIL